MYEPNLKIKSQNKKTWLFMVFNTTFNNISFWSRLFHWVRQELGFCQTHGLCVCPTIFFVILYNLSNFVFYTELNSVFFCRLLTPFNAWPWALRKLYGPRRSHVILNHSDPFWDSIIDTKNTENYINWFLLEASLIDSYTGNQKAKKVILSCGPVSHSYHRNQVANFRTDIGTDTNH